MRNWFGPGRRPFASEGVARVLPGLGVGQEALLEKQEWDLRWVRVRGQEATCSVGVSETS